MLFILIYIGKYMRDIKVKSSRDFPVYARHYCCLPDFMYKAYIDFSEN